MSKIDYEKRCRDIFEHLESIYRSEDDIEQYGIDEYGQGQQLMAEEMLIDFFSDIYPAWVKSHIKGAKK